MELLNNRLLVEKRFKVEPKSIDQRIFTEERRIDSQQEVIRQMILDAFTEVNSNPEKYAVEFEIVIPQKTWEEKNGEQIIELANDFGGYVTDWVEVALAWAQIIDNSKDKEKTWKQLCNDPDGEKYYRMIIWRNGRLRLVGGSEKGVEAPATEVFNADAMLDEKFKKTIPLITLKNKVADASV